MSNKREATYHGSSRTSDEREADQQAFLNDVEKDPYVGELRSNRERRADIEAKDNRR